MPNYKNTVLGARFTIDEAAAAETDGPGEEQGEALALTAVATPSHGKITNGTEFEYQAVAEDNGIVDAGLSFLDDEPGVVYRGPIGLFTVVKVRVTDVDIQEGAIAVPDDEDTVTLALFVNSTLWAIADEGFAPNESFDVGTPVEFNISQTDLALTEDDVIRVVLLGVEANEETLDWDVSNEGTLEIL